MAAVLCADRNASEEESERAEKESEDHRIRMEGRMLLWLSGTCHFLRPCSDPIRACEVPNVWETPGNYSFRVGRETYS
jgi:hypothetical protein